MKTVTLQIEDSKIEQFMTIIHSLKSDLVKNYEVQIQESPADLTADPLAQELMKRIQEIDNGTVEPIPHSEVMDKIYAKWEQKCM